jgi:predicted nucleotidyltransferase
MSVSKAQLMALTEVIVQITHPKLVVLFGSQARGAAAQHSDIDLLIVGERPESTTWSRRREIGRIRRTLPPIGVPVDILFFTPDEVAYWRDTTNHIIHDAFRDGEVLYERP